MQYQALQHFHNQKIVHLVFCPLVELLPEILLINFYHLKEVINCLLYQLRHFLLKHELHNLYLSYFSKKLSFFILNQNFKSTFLKFHFLLKEFEF